MTFVTNATSSVTPVPSATPVRGKVGHLAKTIEGKINFTNYGTQTSAPRMSSLRSKREAALSGPVAEEAQTTERDQEVSQQNQKRPRMTNQRSGGGAGVNQAVSAAVQPALQVSSNAAEKKEIRSVSSTPIDDRAISNRIKDALVSYWVDDAETKAFKRVQKVLTPFFLHPEYVPVDKKLTDAFIEEVAYLFALIDEEPKDFSRANFAFYCDCVNALFISEAPRVKEGTGIKERLDFARATYEEVFRPSQLGFDESQLGEFEGKLLTVLKKNAEERGLIRKNQN